MRKYSYWTDTGNDALDRTSHGMVLAFGFDHIIVPTQPPTDPRTSGVTTVTRHTQNLGKPAIAVEAWPLSGIAIYIGAVPSIEKGDNLGYLARSPMAGSNPLTSRFRLAGYWSLKRRWKHRLP
jgi:hypothetical protein